MNGRHPMRESERIESLSNLLFYGGVFLLVAFLFLIFQPFFAPLAWAGVLAVLCYPWTEKLKDRWGAASTAAAGTVGVTLLLVVPALLLLWLFLVEGVQAARNLQDAVVSGRLNWLLHAWYSLAERAGRSGADLPALVNEYVGRAGTFLAGQLGEVLRNALLFLFELFVTLFALFYFIRDGDAILRTVHGILPFEEETRDGILAQTRRLIHASVRVSLAIAVMQGVLGGLGFALTGIGSPVFWGIVMAFLALLPLVGNAPVWIPAVVWLFATSHPARAFFLLAICAALIPILDSIVRPALLSGSTRLSGLLAFVGVLGGVAAFGLLGIILGPLVVAAAQSVLEVYMRAQKRKRPA